jgi:streptogramin lyase
VATAGPSSPSVPPPSAPPAPAAVVLAGVVHSGQAAVSGALVQIYAAGSSGYGSTATALLSAPVKTDATGSFSVTTSFTCPSSSAPIYLVARGGNPGLAAGTNNSALALMVALGPCAGASTSTVISINEVTTAASVWTLAQFMSLGANVGTSSGNAPGLANAFAMVNNLVNISGGAAPGPALPAGAVAPTPELNTLANILNSCAGSNGSTGECAQLFAAVTPSGGTQPTDTIDAALDIALNPGQNPATIYNLESVALPFQPKLSGAPPDWTMMATYSGGGLNGPASLAIDQAGNVWIADYYGAVTELSPLGQALSPAGGFTGGGLNESYGLAIDHGGNVWVTNQQSPGSVNGGLGSVTELGSSGQVLSGSGGFSGGGVDFPVAVAADSSGNIWISNYGVSTATVLSEAGAALSSAQGYGGGELNFPVAIAIDAESNAWLANQGATTVTSISSDGSEVNQVSCCNGPSALAIDGKGNTWVANFYGNSVSELSAAGTVLSNGYTGGGLLRPQGIAVDGKGNIWVTNYHGNSITELEGAEGSSPGSAVSPAGGFGQAAGLSLPFALAIDGSGNLWVSNFAGNTVTESIGAAAPVKTPLLGPAQEP